MSYQSLIAQGSEYPLKKPAAFHWDFFILGITTFIAGLLGIPAPNGESSFIRELLFLDNELLPVGLIPQAPLHTASLVIMGYEDASSASSVVTLQTGEEGNQAVQLDNMEGGGVKNNNARGYDGQSTRQRRMSNGINERKMDRRREIPVAVVEQRVSNLAQGCLCRFHYIQVPRGETDNV